MKKRVEVDPIDRACVFLLSQRPENLFDPTANPNVVRCKGCGASVKSWKRAEHHQAHRDKEAIMATATKNGRTAPRASSVPVAKDIEKRIVAQIEKGVGSEAISKALNADKVEHPRGGIWSNSRVRVVYLHAKNLKADAWPEVRKQFGLHRAAPVRSTEPRETTKLTKSGSTAKAASVKRAPAKSAAKKTAAPKSASKKTAAAKSQTSRRSAAADLVAGSKVNAVGRGPGGRAASVKVARQQAKDLAGPAKPDPKPIKAASKRPVRAAA